MDSKMGTVIQQGAKARTREILDALDVGVIERQEVLHLAFLCAIAGESIFLLGPPGVGKSMVARRLKYAFKDGESFEYLMNRFSTPDEIFGPISIKQLSEHDRYKRITAHYLPSATVVFLDEIWKAGPSIQNALLTVINEKIYRNGDEEIKVKLQGLIAASNELPAENEGLEALWDRFMVRVYVDRILDSDNFVKMITTTHLEEEVKLDESQKISSEEIELWSNKVNEVDVPSDIIEVILAIRKYIDRHNNYHAKSGNFKSMIYVSDRRWAKVVRLLRTSAFLNERDFVNFYDCFIIGFCIWSKPEQIELVTDWVAQAVSKYGFSKRYNLPSIEKQLEELEEDVKKMSTYEAKINVNKPVLIDDTYYRMIDFPHIHNRITQANFDAINNVPHEIRLRSAGGSSKTYEVARISDFEVEVWIDKQHHRYALEHTQESRIGNLTKSLSEDDHNYLKSRIDQIHDFLDSAAKILEERLASSEMYEHLFASKAWQEKLLTNRNKTFQTILDMKLKVEQIKKEHLN